LSDQKICPQCGAKYSADHRFCSIDGATLVSAKAADDLIGQVVADRYLILEQLGEGGMGHVFLAEHIRMKRKSAVKVMRPNMLSDPIAVSRFHREAENASQISHPNVAAIYDFGETPTGLIFLAMEYVPGEPMSATLAREHALHAIRAADIITQAADALTSAHTLGILHRDLKPDNIMLAKTRSGTDLVKLVDFGIARVMTSSTQAFTSTGIIVGTPDFMSPEQITGETLDVRSDIYALALIAFTAMTGASAFPGGNSRETLLARLMQPPRRLKEVKDDLPWPDELQAVFDKALAADRDERYGDATEFAQALNDAVDAMPATKTMELYLSALLARTTPTRSKSVTPPAVPRVESVLPPKSPPAPEEKPATPSPVTPVVEEPPAPVESRPLTPSRDHRFVIQLAASDEHPISRATSETPPSISPEFETEAEPAIGAASLPEQEPVSPPRARSSSRWLYLTAAGVAAAAILIVISQLGSGNETQVSVVTPDSVTAPVIDSPVAVVPPLPVPTSGALLPMDSVGHRVRGGVFTLFGSLARGVAFLVDSQGIALTTATIPDTARSAQLLLDATRRVVAPVLARDTANGVTALRVPMQHCGACAVLAIAGDNGTAVPQAGDSVVVLGMQTRSTRRVLLGTVTAVGARGPTTSVRTGADDAGAPIVTQHGLVVASVRSGRRPVTTASALRVVQASAAARLAATPPNDSLLPIWPPGTVPARAIAAAAAWPSDSVRVYRAQQDGFALIAMTPQVMAWRDSLANATLRGLRIFAIGDTLRVTDPVKLWPEWETLRRERHPVVVLHVMPDVAVFDRSNPERLLDFRNGDVQAVDVRKDGAPVIAILSARVPAVPNEAAYQQANRRVFQSVIAVYRPQDFALNADGSAPRLQVSISDAARGQRQVSIVLSPAMLQAIARDLRGFQR
jgi:serine/threonine-protein kinase